MEESFAITASSNLSEEEIKMAVDEAEQFAAEDTKRKEAVETTNQCDQLIYQTEKTMKELDAKLDPADKAKIEEGLTKLREARATDDPEKMKPEMEAFSQQTYAIFGKVYQQQSQDNSQGGQGGSTAGGANDDGTVETNFTE